VRSKTLSALATPPGEVTGPLSLLGLESPTSTPRWAQLTVTLYEILNYNMQKEILF